MMRRRTRRLCGLVLGALIVVTLAPAARAGNCCEFAEVTSGGTLASRCIEGPHLTPEICAGEGSSASLTFLLLGGFCAATNHCQRLPAPLEVDVLGPVTVALGATAQAADLVVRNLSNTPLTVTAVRVVLLPPGAGASPLTFEGPITPVPVNPGQEVGLPRAFVADVPQGTPLGLWVVEFDVITAGGVKSGSGALSVQVSPS